MYIYAYICIFMYANMYTYMCVNRMYMYVCKHIYVHIYIYIHTYIYIHIYVYIYIEREREQRPAHDCARCVYKCIYIKINFDTCTYIYVYIYTHKKRLCKRGKKRKVPVLRECRNVSHGVAVHNLSLHNALHRVAVCCIVLQVAAVHLFGCCRNENGVCSFGIPSKVVSIKAIHHNVWTCTYHLNIYICK